MIYLALDSGMRWSELVGLRRGQVDLARRKVRVTEQLSARRRRSGSAGRPRPPPASARSRSRRAPPRCSSATSPTDADDPDELVFTTTAGTAAQHSSFQTHTWKRALAAAGVKCRFHDLRHTSVALAIAAGAHPKAIQVRMGHSTITVTLDRYGHLFPELDEAIASRSMVAFGMRGVDPLRHSHARHVINNRLDVERPARPSAAKSGFAVSTRLASSDVCASVQLRG